MKKLDVFHQRYLRKILGIKWTHHIKNEVVLRRAGQKPLKDIIRERRIRFAGHVLRFPDERPATVSMTSVPAQGKRKRGRPKKTWRATDVKALNISWEDAIVLTSDRKEWTRLVARCPLPPEGQDELTHRPKLCGYSRSVQEIDTSSLRGTSLQFCFC